MIGVTGHGDFKKTQKWLTRFKPKTLFSEMNRYGEIGVKALSEATPKDSGETAMSWAYRIANDRQGPRIEWYNTHDDDSGGTSVAVLIQYGHGTGTGGYVQGRDFINPAMQPIFDKIANDLWKKVKA